MSTQQTIAFIGTGNMANAIIAGLLKNNFIPNNIIASSPSATEKSHLNMFNIQVTSDNTFAAENADIIVLEVKPAMIQSVCQSLKDTIKLKNPIIISIAAGVSTDRIQEALDNDQISVLRAMPNIAATVMASATGLYANKNTSIDEKLITESLFRSIGTILWADDEDKLDAITAIAGSGPAYLFYLFEAMQSAAEALGIDKNSAQLLIAETATGAAKMAMETSESFETLRRFVTSPKGTTEAATDYLSQHNVKEIMMQAVKAAHSRAKALSK